MDKVFLSAGHGGSDPGAVAYGLKEKEINLQTLLACKNELEKYGVPVVCSRTTDVNDPVTDEVSEANASGAKLAVSFHTNAGGGDGFEAFYHTSSANGKKLAQLGEKYVKQLGQNSRGIKSGNKLAFVKNTKMTAVLFESFFVDNDVDNNIGDTIAEHQKFGVAYANAILEYLGINKTQVVKDTAPKTTKQVTVDTAKVFNKVVAGTYRTTADLNLRSGAGTSKSVVTVIPKGKVIQCYGYYTPVVGVKWLLVSYNGMTGFVSSKYLR